MNRKLFHALIITILTGAYTSADERNNTSEELAIDLSFDFEDVEYSGLSYEDEYDLAEILIAEYFRKISSQLPAVSKHYVEGITEEKYGHAKITISKNDEKTRVRLSYLNSFFIPKEKMDNENKWLLSKEQREKIAAKIYDVFNELYLEELKISYCEPVEMIQVEFPNYPGWKYREPKKTSDPDFSGYLFSTGEIIGEEGCARFQLGGSVGKYE